MQFTRLRLLGFKSFVEPSDFIIEPGLTGIVGPNGCGKSNLVEALRWVMGESSYKNMRASGMDDVIFSGSGGRPPRNMAEVTLFLDNSGRTAPPAFNEVDELQVTRRIEREAGSAYRINGKEARAKDVQLLFADQSTGARSPAMVGQGRIGELIQAKPQARRALLEEAAGISGLHSRRHEAELRLRAAEQNLERLEDVVGELESQIESLRRQARQAIRFKTLSAEIHRSEAVLLHLRWSDAKELEGAAQSALAQATGRVGDAAAAQIEAAKVQAVGAHHLPALRERQASATAALQRLTIARSQLGEEAERLRARRSELERLLSQIDADLQRERGMLAENATFQQRLETEAGELAEAIELAAARQEAADAAVRAIELQLAASEAELAEITAERAAALAERSQAERRIREAEERHARLAGQKRQNETALAEIAKRVDMLPDPNERAEAVRALEAQLGAAEQAVERAGQAMALARERHDQARRPAEAARAELARIETEARTLGSILNAGLEGGFPAMLEHIEVARGFEVALGVALGEDLDAPIDSAAPAYWAGQEIAPGDPALPDGVRPFSELVRAPPQLARRLAQTGLVPAADGERLRRKLAPGQCLVSIEGDLWRWDGYVAGADAPTRAAQRLAQKNRLVELEAEADAARLLVRRREGELTEAETAIGAAVAGEREARDAVRELRNRLGTARNALAEAEKASSQLLVRRAALEESGAVLLASCAEAERHVEDARQIRMALPDLDAMEARHSSAASAAGKDRAALAEARSEAEAVARETAARQRRLGAIAEEQRLWRERGANGEEQIAALGERRGKLADELSVLAEAPDEIEARLRGLNAEIAAAEAGRREADDRLAKAETQQKALDQDANAAIVSLSQAREERARAEERLNAAEARRKEIEARIREALNVAPHLALQKAGLEPGAPLPDAESTERRLERLKIERERLGAVNLRAESEQVELSERLDLIVSEREDIVEAIRQLRQAIASLNREGRERLQEAFHAVDEHFRRLFTHLFGGGTAELQLVESEDPLESGLEILARPPGKRPQTMTLLSGGEQALTAMALIFAVFLTNPAPICVLDEVDAPLDDHNVERFCNLMDEMVRATSTRFIIITHNPITMARMSRLYGVTMAEQGVSQLVSVNLEQAEQLRETG